MTESRDRFRAALSGDLKSIDRLPVIEWASWWHLTLNRWAEEGLKADMSAEKRFQALGLDPHRQLWFRHTSPACPKPPAQGKGLMKDWESYLKLKPYLYLLFLKLLRIVFPKMIHKVYVKNFDAVSVAFQKESYKQTYSVSQFGTKEKHSLANIQWP